MAKASLDGIYLKLERAESLVKGLEAEIGAYVTACKDGEIIGEFDPQSSEYVLHLKVPPLPEHWAVAVSEIAHHLRSCLDNIVWQVIFERTGKPNNGSQFPITTSSQQFKEKVKAGWVQGVEGGDRTFIEAAQPYNHGPHWQKRHTLYLLQDLNNIDKHRFLHSGYVAGGYRIEGILIPWYPGINRLVENLPPDGRTVRFKAPMPVPTSTSDLGEGWTFTWLGDEDSTEILRVKVPNPGPNPHMEVQKPSTFAVSLSSRRSPVTVEDLARIARKVRSIADHFQKLLWP
ncbi:MAG TPA: hypothetical protein VG321_08100 [Solirubrobacteraceae bacterium]|jgi:hypothetical protein|nr:hypothetical protein [Solirubrobacteraceae bacterium]